MANKYTTGDFTIPSSLIDDHEWVSDALIDDLGKICTLYYPPIDSECDNCILDINTGRSSSIYKSGGPVSFTNHGICPRCGGLGRLSLESTENITLRIYWQPKDWIDIGIKFNVSDSICMSIGYIADLPKIERANKILIDADQQYVRRWFCVRMGEAAPWGFRHSRYFIQYFKRVGGG